jgi:hypothetical protein
MTLLFAYALVFLIAIAMVWVSVSERAWPRR